MNKPQCPGTGRTERLQQLPSSLVTCPVCGRPNLSGCNVREEDREDDYWTGYGFTVATVPPHSPAKPTPERAEQAIRRTQRVEPWSTWDDAYRILDRGYR